MVQNVETGQLHYCPSQTNCNSILQSDRQASRQTKRQPKGEGMYTIDYDSVIVFDNFLEPSCCLQPIYLLKLSKIVGQAKVLDVFVLNN